MNINAIRHTRASSFLFTHLIANAQLAMLMHKDNVNRNIFVYNAIYEIKK